MGNEGLKPNQEDISQPLALSSENLNFTQPNQTDLAPELVLSNNSERPAGDYAEMYKQIELEKVLGHIKLPVGNSSIDLKTAAALCPVDLSQYSIEEKNDFVAKMLNKSNVELSHEEAELVSVGLARNGIDRLFNIMPQNQTDKSPIKELTESMQAAEMTSKESVQAKVVEPMQTTPIERLLTPQENPVLEDYDKDPVPLATKLADKLLTDIKNTVAKEIEPVVRHRPELPAKNKAKSVSKESRQTQPQSITNVVEMSADEQVLFDRSVDQVIETDSPADHPATVPIDEALPTQSGLIAKDETVRVPSLELAAPPETEDQPSEAVVIEKLETILNAEPEQLAERFIKGINELIKLSAQIAETMELPSSSDEIAPAIPAVVVVLSEIVSRTREADPSTQDTVYLVMQQLTGAIHGKMILESYGSEPEKLAQIDLVITRLCINLLDSLEIEHTPDMIETLKMLFNGNEFIAGMLAANDLSWVDIEAVGTREIKRFRKELLSKAQLFKTGSVVQWLGLTALIRQIESELGLSARLSLN